MGNLSSKSEPVVHQIREKRVVFKEQNSYASQFSLSSFINNLSGRSVLSTTSNQTVYSASRSWSRTSNKRCDQSSTLSKASKTVWPVRQTESAFLPEFPITTQPQGEFQLGDIIAKGAFSQVFKVKRSDEKEYALKVLSKAKIVSENAVRQVKEEAKIQETCGHHPFIVGLVSKWQTKQHLYIVSEFVPGGELLNLLQYYGKLPEELVKVFVAELAIVIDFLHGAGVVYRDLKPENVLLDEQFHLKLIDFGLSKWLSYGARTSTICGTFNYIAPEILGHESYGHSVDWWSLGVVACQMLTSQFPTPAIDSRKEDVLDSESQADPPKPGRLPAESINISDAARKLLTRLLEVDPKYRLKSLRELEQSAFFMRFNIQDVRTRKLSPKSILDKYFPLGPPNQGLEAYADELREASLDVFSQFGSTDV